MSIDKRAAGAGLAILLVAGTGEAVAQSSGTITLPEIQISATPVPTGPSSGLDVNKVPSNVTIVTAKDFAQRNAPSVADTITARVPGAIALNVDGSDLSPDLFYRGFDASRIAGTAQGLAVYENGVRINEVFGDTVNLDLIPPIAIATSDVYSGNPIFGLNALGGAINFTMKNGFTYHGGEASVYGGSYGRVDGVLQYGKQSGDWGFYFATDELRDGGFRPFGASNLERAYADIGHKTQDSEIHLIGGFGRSFLGTQGTTPAVLVNQQYTSVFTTPQTTNNQSGLVQLTGTVDITPHWTLSGNAYVRQFDQFHVDGNDSNLTDCQANGTNPKFFGDVCSQSGGNGTTPNATVLRGPDGKVIPYLGDNFAYGTTTLTSTHSTSEGVQLQATNKDTYFGHDNYFVVGGSFDHGNAHFNAHTLIGELNSQFQNITSGINLPGIGDVAQTQGQVGYSSVYVASTTSYYGVFALDTFNITKDIALTGGARFNLADIGLQDLGGLSPSLNAQNKYERINPVVGLTYTIIPELTLYGGYSEANRAPVPLESACSDPMRPCTLENALVSDPPLQQVVSHTFEGGGRGAIPLPQDYGQLTYKAGYFHTTSTNDIISVPSVFSGQGYFANVPETLRQGIEAGVEYDHGPWNFYGNYALINATYQFSGKLSTNSPSANAAGNIFIHPGDNIPGIPRNLGKIGAEYHVTPRFVVGMDTILVGSQYYIGDDSNQQPQLPFYYAINGHASYQLTDHVQVFTLVNNLTNNHYATYGAFYQTATTGSLVNSTLAANANAATPDARAVTVAQPLSVYGGIKITF